MNLPEVEMAVQVFGVLGFTVKPRVLKISKVILIRTTEKSYSMLLCIFMRCIVTPKIPHLISVSFVLYDTSIIYFDLEC